MQTFKALLGFFIYGFTLLVVAAAGALWWGAMEYKNSGPLLMPFEFHVERGMSLGEIAHTLEEQGAIRNQYLFMASARMLGQQSNLKAGEYALEPGMSMQSILQDMTAGKTIQRRITFREGLTSYEIVEQLKDIPALDGEITSIPEEGSLLPETYDYRKNESRLDVLERMQSAMTETVNRLWEEREENLPFTTKEEALTLASIIEKETGKSEERARVAGVFINRLRKGIPLQTDPTVIYALTKGEHENEGQGPLGRRLLRKDMEYDSPYNTYLYLGLPPGPIANPGAASIEAALHPEEHDFIYFVADGTGGHVFAKTLSEHNRNAAKWRSIRRKQQ